MNITLYDFPMGGWKYCSRQILKYFLTGQELLQMCLTHIQELLMLLS